ncbi:MAG: HAMP domain-containing sensor histidine kinase [Spirochaetaceae bacterium]|nr:HAMP domain-containing sensor histidine kinase [Spirochaetaceae bacterium]MDT8297050.1 HAMP domain-containing sensor histidine kinase [Spirochaetaceae bacterium]
MGRTLTILHIQTQDAVSEDRQILEKLGGLATANDVDGARNVIETNPPFDVVVVSHDEGTSDVIDLLTVLHDWDVPVAVIEDYDTLAPIVLSLTLGEHIVRTLSLPMILPARIDRLIRLRHLREEADRYIMGHSGLTARDRFMTHVVHEMRNPLHGMLGLVDVLRTTELDEHQRAYCELLQNAGDGMNGMLEDLIEFSRTEDSGKGVSQSGTAIGILQSAAENLEKTADAVGLKLTLEIDGSIGAEALLDPLAGRILDKLIMNAVLYTNQGGIKVLASLQGDDYRIVVTDTGRGIPPGLRDSLFEPFRRYQSVTEKALPGLGLGLTLSRMWARRLGGDVRLDRNEYGGTSAVVTIPKIQRTV